MQQRLPFAFYALVQVVFLFVHYPTTHRFPRIATFACLVTLLFHCYTEYTLQSPGEDYILGCSNGILLVTAAHMMFSCPDFPNGFHRTDHTASEAKSGPSELPFAQKLGWMVGLAGDMRRIGFTHGGATNRPANVDNRGRTSSSARTHFVISRVILSVVCLATFHLTLLYPLQNPFFDPTLHKDAHDEVSSLLRRFRTVTVWLAGVVSEMSFLQTIAAAVSVGVGASEPGEWPAMFGLPTHAYSVRRFWSKTWHQVLRAPLAGSGAHLAQNILKLDRGTVAFTIVQTTAAFFLSALTHTGGDYAIHRTFERSGPTFQFFLLQPAAILFEEMAIRAARRWVLSSTRVRVRVPEPVWRAAGYVWVGLWFAWCTPPWLDAISAAGGNVRTRLIPLKMLERLV